METTKKKNAKFQCEQDKPDSYKGSVDIDVRIGMAGRHLRSLTTAT